MFVSIFVWCVCDMCVYVSTVWCYSPRDADLPGIMNSEG